MGNEAYATSLVRRNTLATLGTDAGPQSSHDTVTSGMSESTALPSTYQGNYRRLGIPHGPLSATANHSVRQHLTGPKAHSTAPASSALLTPDRFSTPGDSNERTRIPDCKILRTPVHPAPQINLPRQLCLHQA